MYTHTHICIGLTRGAHRVAEHRCTRDIYAYIYLYLYMHLDLDLYLNVHTHIYICVYKDIYNIMYPPFLLFRLLKHLHRRRPGEPEPAPFGTELPPP